MEIKSRPVAKFGDKRAMSRPPRRAGRERRGDKNMDEYKYKRWGIILKVAGLVGVILSGLWAVHTYSEDKTKEQNSFIFQHQATAYWDVSRVAASLAASRDEKTKKEAEERFLQLF